MGALTHGAKLVCFNLFFNFHLNMMNLCLFQIFLLVLQINILDMHSALL